MGESVTLTESHYKNLLKRAGGTGNAGDALPGESAGMAEYKRGNKKGGLGLMYGANAVAVESVLAGGALYYLAKLKAVTDIQVFKDHWWLKGLLAMGFGYWLFRRGSAWAPAVLSAAAAMLVEAYQNKDKAPATTSGFEWEEGEEAGAEDWRRLPERRERMGERLRDRVYARAA